MNSMSLEYMPWLRPQGDAIRSSLANVGTATGQDRAEHWDAAYAYGDGGKSWYQKQAATSEKLIRSAGRPTDSVIDIGGGASTLVDGLLSDGYGDLSVLDVSVSGLDIARARLGPAGDEVDWLTEDLLGWRPDRTFEVWHDRAVLHFLIEPADQSAYLDVLLAATRTGSRVVIGVFGPEGPPKCSGLAVRRYSSESMADFLPDGFQVTGTFILDHSTPSGGLQQFLWTTATRLR